MCMCVCVFGGGSCYWHISMEGCVHPSKSHYEVSNQEDYKTQSNIRILKWKVKTAVLFNGTQSRV